MCCVGQFIGVESLQCTGDLLTGEDMKCEHPCLDHGHLKNKKCECTGGWTGDNCGIPPEGVEVELTNLGTWIHANGLNAYGITGSSSRQSLNSAISVAAGAITLFSSLW